MIIAVIRMAALVGCFAASAPAVAQLRMCNSTDSEAMVALAERVDGRLRARGWFQLGPSLCGDLKTEPLTERNYYFFASQKERTWEGTPGEPQACLRPQPFDLPADDCRLEGEVRNLRTIDTGGRRDFLVVLNSTTDHSNGCGSGWNEPLVPDTPMGFKLKAACDDHDNCYSRCMQGGLNHGDPFRCDQAPPRLEERRSSCDETFERAIARTCTEHPLQGVCRTLGKIYYISVRLGGKGSFNGREIRDLIARAQANPRLDTSAIDRRLDDVIKRDRSVAKLRIEIKPNLDAVVRPKEALETHQQTQRGFKLVSPKEFSKGLPGQPRQ